MVVCRIHYGMVEAAMVHRSFRRSSSATNFLCSKLVWPLAVCVQPVPPVVAVLVLSDFMVLLQKLVEQESM